MFAAVEDNIQVLRKAVAEAAAKLDDLSELLHPEEAEPVDENADLHERPFGVELEWPKVYRAAEERQYARDMRASELVEQGYVHPRPGDRFPAMPKLTAAYDARLMDTAAANDKKEREKKWQ